MRKGSWGLRKNDVSSHGWNGNHFYVHGKMVCNTSGRTKYVDLRGILQFNYKRQPKIVKRSPYGSGPDCKQCTKIWLELYYVFKKVDIQNNRLFPEKEYFQHNYYSPVE